MIIEMDFAKAWALQKAENVIFVDVRSENEYNLDHVPNAINIPILNNEVREKTGILYKQVSHAEARRYGFSQVAPMLPAMVEQITELSKSGRVVIYCSRGGMRSQSIAAVLDIMRIPVIRLTTGYKDYRHYVNDFWQKPFAFPVVVLHGLTGVGKTRIIKALANIPNGDSQFLDLEGLAGHRGSAFGAIGLAPQPSQKAFETNLWYLLEKFSYNKQVLVECESKRIGRLLLPDSLFNAMSIGRHILAIDTIDNRVVRILEDYEPQIYPDAIINAIERLNERLGKQKVAELCQSIRNGIYEPVVATLLTDYYDPLYKYPDQKSNEYEFTVNAADIIDAAIAINRYLGSN